MTDPASGAQAGIVAGRASAVNVSAGQSHTDGHEAVAWGLWEQFRDEERARQLRHVVQDTIRDALIADALAGRDAEAAGDSTGRVRHRTAP